MTEADGLLKPRLSDFAVAAGSLEAIRASRHRVRSYKPAGCLGSAYGPGSQRFSLVRDGCRNWLGHYGLDGTLASSAADSNAAAPFSGDVVVAASMDAVAEGKSANYLLA